MTGVLATSGIFAIVLGLALQSTLADVFAGIAMGVEAPFRVGDRIQIGDKVEGQVEQINWRSIRIQTDGGDIAIFPNSIVAKTEIINRSFPSPERTASIELSCPAESDPERVIEALREATLLCPGILQAPAPGAALVRLGVRRNSYSIWFSVESTRYLTSQRMALLIQARRQLYFSALAPKSEDVAGTAMAAQEGRPAPSSVHLMRELTLFECLSQLQLQQLALSVTSIYLEPGELLFSKDACDATLYMIAAGVLKLEHQTDRSGPTAIGSIGAGEYIGELGLLTGAPHAVTAVARTRCHVYTISKDAIAPLLSENPGLVAAFDRSVRRGQERLHREVAARATGDAAPKEQLIDRIRSFFRV